LVACAGFMAVSPRAAGTSWADHARFFDRALRDFCGSVRRGLETACGRRRDF
jgi:hypothetical protein